MTTTTTLPGIEITDLPSLDDEVPCTVTVNDSPLCPIPAAWRLLARCPRCNVRGMCTVCDGHRTIMVTRGFGATTTSACCGALVDARWERL
jgi:hypothetical protein